MLVGTGRSWQDKVADIREKMETEGASVVMVTELDEVACELVSTPTMYTCTVHKHTHSHTSGLFNLRGSDIEYNPVFFAYAMVTTEDVR